MKFNLLRIITVVVVFCLIGTVWYLRELNDNVRSNNRLLLKEKADIERKITAIYAAKNSLETEILTAEKEKEQIFAKMNEYETENKALASELENLKTNITSLNEELAKKELEIKDLKEIIESYKKETYDLEERLRVSPAPKELQPEKEAIELPAIKVAAKEKRRTARVLDINRDYDFIVINAGRDQGISQGDILLVCRGTKVLGRVVVEKAAGDISIAKMLYKYLRDNVEVGDAVRY